MKSYTEISYYYTKNFMKKTIKIKVEINRIDIAVLRAMSEDLAAIGIDFEHTGKIEYDDNDTEIIGKIQTILDKYFLS